MTWTAHELTERRVEALFARDWNRRPHKVP